MSQSERRLVPRRKADLITKGTVFTTKVLLHTDLYLSGYSLLEALKIIHQIPAYQILAYTVI
jgi:hypothetical protein